MFRASHSGASGMATDDPRYRTARGPIGLVPRRRGLSAWYRHFGEDLARERGLYKKSVSLAKRNAFIAQKAAEKLATLSKTTKELREYFRGFKTDDGYDLRDIRRWSLHQVREVEKYGEYLHHLTSQPHERKIPRSKKQRTSIQAFTGQNLKRQRAFVVHKTHPDEEIQISSSGEVVVMRKLAGDKGYLRSDFYFFRTLLGYQPLDWDEVYSATAEILPFMPDGMYFIYSSLHGEIDAPHPKRSLLQVIARYRLEYTDKKFAHTILGFKRLADQIRPDEEYSKIYHRRRSAHDRRKRSFDALTKKAARSVQRKKRSRKHK